MKRVDVWLGCRLTSCVCHSVSIAMLFGRPPPGRSLHGAAVAELRLSQVADRMPAPIQTTLQHISACCSMLRSQPGHTPRASKLRPGWRCHIFINHT